MAMAMAMSGEYMACAALAMESTITTPAFSIPCRASFLASRRVAIQEHAVFPNHRSIIYPCSNLQDPFRRGPYSAASFAASSPTPFEEVEVDRESVPKPIVVIDQDSDPHATVVELGFGDRLGALLDTVGALKELGLNVVKGTVSSSSLAPNKFSITRADTGRKVENPELLETIRLTIINNLLQYHPESSEQLAMGEAFGIKPPKEKLDVNVATHITIKRDGPKRSLLTIKTADRPGLLMEIVKVISDTSVAVESGEVETEGLVAKDKLHVSYQGAALSKSMEEVLTNCLRYYLRRPETDVDSY